jgi:perosamine synthetase
MEMDENLVKRLLEQLDKPAEINFMWEDKIGIDELTNILEVFKTQKLSSLEGDMVNKFEKAFAEFIGVKYAIAVNSGTAALHVALKSMGVGPGDEVIVPPFTFIATASSVLHCNAIPIFADIEPITFNMDPNDAIKKITDKTKVIIPVHLAGTPANIDPLLKVCKEKGIMLLEDAAQSIGAKYKGKYVTSIGDAGIFSFYPSKIMTTGEGGMIFTNNSKIAELSRQYRHHGEIHWYDYQRIGWNFRMDEIQAAIGLAQLKKLPSMITKRQQIGYYLNRELTNVKGIKTPEIPSYAEPSFNWWAGYVKPEEIGLKTPQEYVKRLDKDGKLLSIIYPEPLYMTKIFQDLVGFGHGCPWDCKHYGKKIEYNKGLCPNVEKISPNLIHLGLQPNFRKEHLDYIVSKFKKISQ